MFPSSPLSLPIQKQHKLHYGFKKMLCKMTLFFTRTPVLAPTGEAAHASDSKGNQVENSSRGDHIGWGLLK